MLIYAICTWTLDFIWPCYERSNVSFVFAFFFAASFSNHSLVAHVRMLCPLRLHLLHTTFDSSGLSANLDRFLILNFFGRPLVLFDDFLGGNVSPSGAISSMHTGIIFILNKSCAFAYVYSESTYTRCTSSSVVHFCNRKHANASTQGIPCSCHSPHVHLRFKMLTVYLQLLSTAFLPCRETE